MGTTKGIGQGPNNEWERILFAVVVTGTLFAAIAFLPGFALAIQESRWTVLGLNCGVLLCGLALLLFRRTDYVLRASIALMLVYAVGLYICVYYGLFSGGPFWLFAFGVMSGLLLGLRAAIIAVCVNLGTLLALGWWFMAGPGAEEYPFFKSTLRAVTAGGSFLLMNMVAAFSCAVLIRRLHVLALEEKSIARSFEQEKDRLLEVKRTLEGEILRREETEEKLKESEARYRLLAENVSDIIWTADMTLRPNYVSPSIERVRGFTPAEAMQLTLEEQLTPESLNVVRQVFLEELSLEQTGGADPYRARTMELEFRCKNGSTIWSELRVSFIRDDKGEAKGFLGVGRNIAERRRAETERRDLEARLHEAKKMEAIATLARGIAHQFNNALSVISMSIDGLEMELGKHVGDGDYLSKMRATYERMSRLTDQLLAYARGGKYRVKAIPMGELIETGLAIVLHSLQPTIRLEKSIPAGLWRVEVDVTQMHMALSAILSNASEAIEREGLIRFLCANVDLKDSREEPGLGLDPGRYVRLEVEDSGVGMDDEAKRRIFEPFFTTKFQGRGLGMAAVFGIVKNHGGSISVDSAPGKGTRVRLYLPAVEQSRLPDKEVLSGADAGVRTLHHGSPF
ncbi:MAG: PAS domain S-box protein [Desulfobacterota bacterium]|jgi:PAS domain S-box-containing protein|nr:PAS domain S-box protein [Thermodesulfobacteriota bacterium]